MTVPFEQLIAEYAAATGQPVLAIVPRRPTVVRPKPPARPKGRR